MMCQPIIIDGPARRRKMMVERGQFVVVRSPKIRFRDCSDLLSLTVPTFDEVLYHVHRFKIGEFTFAIASVNPKPPPIEKALKLIFTASARQAVIR
jgi:hypothetical protein